MKTTFFAIISILFLLNCSTTTHIKSFNGTKTPEGKPAYYQTTTNLAVQFFFGIFPIHEKFGNSSFEQTLNDFTKDVVKNKKSKVHIIQRESSNYWYVGFPFTVILTPVTTELTGYVVE
ncbi:MAG: hypothetical protein H7A24_16415 [Leptospiraceae bacterium]|nr:hypothetical protein [Leptospiraceae bacterium]MCP5513473.1 hypothetical protein [Leptospiraceae bacterium]